MHLIYFRYACKDPSKERCGRDRSGTDCFKVISVLLPNTRICSLAWRGKSGVDVTVILPLVKSCTECMCWHVYRRVRYLISGVLWSRVVLGYLLSSGVEANKVYAYSFVHTWLWWGRLWQVEEDLERGRIVEFVRYRSEKLALVLDKPSQFWVSSALDVCFRSMQAVFQFQWQRF